MSRTRIVPHVLRTIAFAAGTLVLGAGCFGTSNMKGFQIGGTNSLAARQPAGAPTQSPEQPTKP